MSSPHRLATILLLALAAPLSTAAEGTQEVQALLRQADAFRQPTQALEVLTDVQVLKHGEVDKDRTYLVYVKPGRRSLVLSRSPVEKGQKVLMVGDDFWIVLPGSQRPVRITPAQKLLGDAATGDVATLAWADDYDGKVLGEEDVGGVPCHKLELTARRRGVTYQRIVLLLSRADAHPVAAELYVASDRLTKRVTFELGTLGGREGVVAMHLHDEIQPGRETVIHYRSRAARALDDAYFNPMFLTRHDPE